ncbi:MAG: hypothetical protein M1836_006823 [Candelina mexicana]|nr:MAG: hypothetical protein M1836_006823 [Candelina mexicana]
MAACTRAPQVLKGLCQSPTTSISLVRAASSSSFARAVFAKLRVQPCPVVRTSPTFRLPDVLIEEEQIHGYNSRTFYPVNLGEVLNDRYEITTKLGYGHSSTVWLAQDIGRWRWQSNRYVVLKINRCSHLDGQDTKHELNIARHIAQADISHVGSRHVRTILDDFEVKGPFGTHVCLVYEPMREPLLLYQHRLLNGRVPLPLLKAHMVELLYGLDYLHSECHVVHTGKLPLPSISRSPHPVTLIDLQRENILMHFESASVIEKYVRKQQETPMPRKLREDGGTIYLSHQNLGPVEVSHALSSSIADFGHAKRLDGGYGKHSHQPIPIQLDRFRAPEVILGTGWSYSADIWNLGVLIWDLLENRPLFTNIRTRSKKYYPERHLAQMIALLGPPPHELLKREREGRHWRWQPKIPNASGKLCDTAIDFYGGSFFDFKDIFKYPHLIPKGLSLANTITSLSGNEKAEFLDFVKKMLQWQPEKRKTAKELLDDPWLAEVKKRQHYEYIEIPLPF